jgi:hypothetical protein
MTSKEIAEKLLELFSSRDIRVNNEIAETVTDEEFEVYQSTAIQIALKFKDIDHFHNYLFSYLFHLEDLCSNNCLNRGSPDVLVDYDEVIKRFQTFLSYIKLEVLDEDIQQFIKTHLKNN